MCTIYTSSYRFIYSGHNLTPTYWGSTNLGSGAHMAKTDVKSAFRIVPIHPEDFHLLGMKLDGLYFYETTLPMGCSMSCAIFEAFSSAVQWIATNKLGNFLIIGPSSHEASIQLERFLDFCEECGIPMSP